MSWEVTTELSHAHNFILNFAYKNGVIISIIYIIWLYWIAKSIDKCVDIKSRDLMKITYLTFLVLNLYEAYQANCACLFFLGYLFVNNKLFTENKEKQLTEENTRREI